ncbi:MAG: RNA polymerase sigma factor [Rhizomicrobium sp.]
MAEVLTFSDLESVFLEARPDLERMLRRRTGSSPLAADLAQELYLKLRRIATPLPNRHEARAYLFRMAANLATDHRRVEGRRMELLAGNVSLFSGIGAGPEDDALTRGQMRLVEAALAELPPRCKDVLYMSRMLGMTHSEIAAELGVSRSSVEKYVMRALLHCRERLAGS